MSKVVGGIDAPDGRFPYVISIQNSTEDIGSYYSPYYYGDINPFHFCGGSLITPEVVLTAAHCFDFFFPEDAPLLTIAVGCNDISQIDDCTLVGVDDFVVNPLYEFFNFGDDVALIFLSEAVEVPTVALAGPGIVPENGEPVTGLGWGATLDFYTSPAAVLQEVELDIVENDVCVNQLLDAFAFKQKIYDDAGYNYDFTLDDSNLDTIICTIGDAEDVCFGDSGGPLIYRCDTDDVPDLQIGIVSFGLSCALEGIPGGFEITNSAATRAFIEATFVDKGLDIADVTFIDDIDEFCPEFPIVAGTPTPFPTLDLNDSWICNVSFWATNDGCDCECGAPDPDCELQADIFIFGCEENEICVEGICEVDIGDGSSDDEAEVALLAVGAVGGLCVLACVCAVIFSSCIFGREEKAVANTDEEQKKH